MKQFLQALILCMVFGCKPATAPESQHDRYFREAKSTMGDFCSNDIVGFKEIKSMFLNDGLGDTNKTSNPSLWEGNATVDYINKVGGVERTNIVFHFKIETNSFLVRDDKTFVSIDRMFWIMQQVKAEAAAAQRELDERIKKTDEAIKGISN